LRPTSRRGTGRDEGHTGHCEGHADDGERGEGFPEDGPRHEGGDRGHEVQEARNPRGVAPAEQAIEEEGRGNREHEHGPAEHGVDPRRPLDGPVVDPPGGEEAGEPRERELHGIPGHEVDVGAAPLLVEHPEGHGADRDHHRGNADRIAEARELVVDDEDDPEKAEREAHRHPPIDALPDEACREGGGKEGLGSHHQRGDPRLHPEVERNPHPPEANAVDEQPDDREVTVVDGASRPRGANQDRRRREQNRRHPEPPGEEPNRSRVRHREPDHHVSGGPKDHEQAGKEDAIRHGRVRPLPCLDSRFRSRAAW